MARAQRKRFLRLGSARKVRSAGILLGVLIMLSLGTLILQDRHARIEAATRQSQALALGADRLLHYEMRNLERAMDAALEAIGRLPPGGETDPPQFRRAVAGVLGRVSEFDSISLVDRNGRSLSGDADAADIPQWLPATGSERRLYLGTLWQSPEAGWLVPLAVPTPSGHWLIAQLKASELQKMIASLDTGREGSIAVIDRNGVVLAREGTPGTYVGRKIPLPPEALKAQGLTSMQIRSRLDAVIRLASFSAGSGYPMLIGAGIGLDEALAPWWRQAWAALALVALYWVILVFMVRRLRTAETVRERMLDALAAQSEWLREAQEASRTGVWRIEPDQLRVHVSAHMAAMFGFPAVEATLPIVDFFARMHDDDRPMAEAAYAHARATGTPYVAQYRVRQPDGSVRWIKARGAVAMDSESDGHGLMTGTVIDVTEQHEARMRIEQGEIQFRALFERNPLPFWVFDEATLRFLAVNDAAIAAYGYSREEFLAMTILDIRPREDVDEVRASVLPEQSEHVEPVWRHVTRDGKRIEVQIHVNHIDFAGRRARLVLAEDVSERLAYERDLAWRAEHDTTTGLLTLPALVERLDAVSAAQDVEQPPCYAVAYVRLRDLEVVAPTLGRRAGENILCEAAARFREIGDAFGLVAYSPAESFVIAALDVTRRDALIARLMDATSQPVPADGGSHPLEAWIGVADGPCPVESAEQTVAHAALAALQARHDNQPVVHFDASMAEQAAERLALVGRLRRALHNREFELFFQPIRRIADGSTVAFEALLRWRQADGGYVPPVQFIPLCEASGLIVPIGAWVLEEAARAHGLLSAAGHGHIAIAVNVSAVQLLADSLADTMRGLRRKYDLPRGALHVELTESVVLHRPEAARALMRDLQAQGACISLDDFGTGFSSMAYLRDLPLDHLKIDRTFVRDVHEDERNASICRALIALGHGLGLGIVAEGVETEAQLAWLRAEGCDQVQGYLLGRPAPLDEVLAGLPRPALARRAG